MRDDHRCRRCNRTRVYTDLALLNDEPLCHGVVDPSPTCYQLAVIETPQQNYHHSPFLDMVHPKPEPVRDDSPSPYQAMLIALGSAYDDESAA